MWEQAIPMLANLLEAIASGVVLAGAVTEVVRHRRRRRRRSESTSDNADT